MTIQTDVPNSVGIMRLGDPRLLLDFLLVFIFILPVASCRRGEQRPQADRVPVAQLEQTYGRLLTIANQPTPDQHGTGDLLGLFRDVSGTVWGIPLTIDDKGNLLGCAPPMLRDAPPSGTLSQDTVEIIGAANEPTGWREGTGKLGVLLRDTQGRLSWTTVQALEIKTGPICLSQSPPVQPLKFYRLAKANGGK